MAFLTRIAITHADREMLSRFQQIAMFREPKSKYESNNHNDRKADAVEHAIEWARETGESTEAPADFAASEKIQIKLFLSRDYLRTYSASELAVLVHKGIGQFWRRYRREFQESQIVWWESGMITESDWHEIIVDAFRQGRDPRPVLQERLRQEIREGGTILGNGGRLKRIAVPLTKETRDQLLQLEAAARFTGRNAKEVLHEARHSMHRRRASEGR